MSRHRRPWRFAATGALLGIAAGLAYWFLVLDPAGQPPSPPSPATVAFYDRHGTLLYEALDPIQGTASYVPLGEVSRHLAGATVATEDASFYSNPGIDIGAIIRALIQNTAGDGITSGGSTLTQQLARNLYMSPAERSDRSLRRKIREAALALRLAARLSKDEVLEWYLNSVSYGHQTVGVESAARVYFGKRARDLDLAESALLAGLPQAPSLLDPFLDLEAARSRQLVVLSLMVRHGIITAKDASAAMEEPIRLAPAAFPIKAPHFVAFALSQLAELPELEPASVGKVSVHTSLDLGLQETADAIVKRRVAELKDKSVTNGALVALDTRTGEILAMVGSADYFDPGIEGEVNVAVSARQPGSAIKPILYAAALEAGFTPASVLYDVPATFLTADGKSYSPENYDRTWHGPVTFRDSLANSYNLPSVRLLQQVGVQRFLEAATRAGLATLSTKGDGDLSLALGSGEVRLLDLTSAFSAFSSGGIAAAPTAITRVEDEKGNVLWEAGGQTWKQVTSSQVAYLITSILSDNYARSPSFGSDSPLRLSRPAAAKTGTTTDWRDNWTVGYTPELATGVWVGNADNTPMRGVSGISGAAPIWHDFMEEALKGHPVSSFHEPSGLVREEICPESGQLPSRWCPNRRQEVFVAGAAPTSTCDWHQSISVDKFSGLPTGPDTPMFQVENRVFLVLPPELEEWARSRGIPAPPAPAPRPGSNEPRLLLTRPPHGTVYQISPDLPLDTQQLEVTAAGARLGERTRVEVRLNGQVIASFREQPYRFLWQLAPGRHRFEAVAVDSAGETVAWDEAEITVESRPSPP